MNNQLFGAGFLGQVPLMGQNYRNPYPVSQESQLPSRELTDDQLADWEAEHGEAPPGSHPSRPYVSPEERAAEEEAAAQAEADAAAQEQAEADAAAQAEAEAAQAEAAAQAHADAAAQADADAAAQADADAAAQADADAAAQADADAAAPEQANEAAAPDTYSDTVDALCQLGERFNKDDAEWEVTRGQFNAGEAAALSAVPENLQTAVQNAAKKNCPKYQRTSLWMEIQTFAAQPKPPAPQPTVIGPEPEPVASFDPRAGDITQEQAARFPAPPTPLILEDVETPGGGTPTPATVQAEAEDTRGSMIQGCPPGFTQMPNGECAPDQTSGGIPGVDFGAPSGMETANIPTGMPTGMPDTGGIPGGGMPGGDPFDPMADPIASIPGGGGGIPGLGGRYPVMNL